MNRPRSILVLGLGELGAAVAGAVADHPARPDDLDLAVLLRGPSIESPRPGRRREVEALRGRGARFLAADLAADPVEAIAAHFRPFDLVVGCTGFAAGRGVQRKLARAALEAGVRRYIPWQFGVDYDVIGRGGAQDLFDEQLDVRDLLRGQSRTGWVVISTGMFTSFLFDPAFGVVDLAGGAVHALGDWENAVTVTTPEDVGRLTAEVAFADPPIVDRVVYTAGDTITYGRLADVVESVLGREVAREAWSVPFLRGELAKAPDDPLRKYRLVFAEGRGVSWPKGSTFNARRGIEVQDVEGWARANLRA